MAQIMLSKDLGRLISDIQKFGQRSLSPIIKQAVYVGAGYMADRIKKELQALPVQDGKRGLPPYVSKGKKLDSISSVQKKDLINSFGVTPFKYENGYTSVKIGFDNYGSYSTRRYPKGIPNQLLARSLERGTSFLKPNKVITRTVNSSKNQTLKIMEQEFKNQIEKEFK